MTLREFLKEAVELVELRSDALDMQLVSLKWNTWKEDYDECTVYTFYIDNNSIIVE